MKKLLFSLLLGLALLTPHIVQATEKSLCNPKPLADDLIIPGPEGTCFAFRPVMVSGDTPFSGETFVMGDAEEDTFRMPSTEVMVGGSFLMETETTSWVYYIGKYEITRKQYKAIMGSLPAALKDKESTPEKDNLPVTSLTYFEALQFVDKLNQWIYANAEAKDSMPRSGAYPGFMRLPSEAEWEFAARGGKKVKKAVFESATPYGDRLSAHEWFNGPKSSHGKMKAVGLLQPNPLGIHDMLGNVQEIASNQYQFEYYQGRSGGFTSRGGSFILAEDKLRSAMRQEEPYYLARKDKLTPNAKITLGLRLAISAPLLTDKAAIEEFEEAWELYRDSARAQTPAGLSMAPLGDQAIASFQSAFERIRALKELQDAEYSHVNWKQELAYAVDGMIKGQKNQESAQKKTAEVLIMQTHVLSQELARHFNQYAVLQERLPTKIEQKERETWIKRINALNFVIEGKLERYGENLMLIDTVPVKFMEEAFTLREQKTQKDTEINDAERNVALAMLAMVRAHYNEFTKNKRTDLVKWHKDYENSIKK